MISLVTSITGAELGYLFDDLFIPLNTIKAVTDGKISYESKKEGFFEKDKVVIPAMRKKFDILSKDYTNRTGMKYLSILRENNIKIKRYAYIGISTNETLKDCSHYIWGLGTFPNRYYIYDTYTEQQVGYLLTSIDLYSPSEPNIQIGMIEIKDKGKGTGTQVIRELLKYRPLRGLADSNSKPFWSSLNVKYMDDNMHFSLD